MPYCNVTSEKLTNYHKLINAYYSLLIYCILYSCTVDTYTSDPTFHFIALNKFNVRYKYNLIW